ncbi:MAG: class II aldolase/adducin family protein [Anaerolineae bacterium]|nr:class II aldolase/adducin family protein [Anaerolineae bacterium]
MLSPIPYSERNLPTGLPIAPSDEASLRTLICHIGRLMYQGRYIDSWAGNISARLDDGHILATPSGLAKGFLQPDQLIVLDMDGNKVGPGTDANHDLRPTSELLMHLECYRQRPDVNGVVHAHPATAIALTIAGISLRTCVVPEAIVVLGVIPTATYSTPAGAELRDSIRPLVGQHDAIMLEYHGSLTLGADVWQAYMKLEMLEQTATILHRAAQLGPITPLKPEQVAKLLQMRRDQGYWRPGDEDRFCEACGVC